MLTVDAHHGQFDKGGRPYILHPLAVMNMLRAEDDEELQCIALGHDLFEDTNVTIEDLRKQEMPDRVIEGIVALTKQRGESNDDYRAKVKANPDAVRVKKKDLLHNSDIRRLKGVTDADVRRMVRYHQFYLELAALDNDSTAFHPFA